MKPINLGQKYNSPCCAPVEMKPEDRVHFPCVYLNDVNADIPDAGTITFRYEVRSRNERPKDGETSLDLELLQIVDVKEDAKSEAKLSAAQTLDKLAKEVTKEEPDDAEEESSRESYVADES